LSFRERLFLSWLAPRGIVAAAIATVFAQSMDEAQIPGGGELRALVFMVIAVTVVVQGLSGGRVASLLGLRRAAHEGLLILGANPLARALAAALVRAGEEVTLVDRNPDLVRKAEEAGLRVLFGNGLEERTLERAAVESRSACIGATANEEVNLLFARRAREEFNCQRLYLAMDRHDGLVELDMVREAGAQVLFGGPVDLELWAVRLGHGDAQVSAWELGTAPAAAPEPVASADGEELAADAGEDPMPRELLALVVVRGAQVWPMSAALRLAPGDRVEFAIFNRQAAAVEAWLRRRGWSPVVPAGSTAAAIPPPNAIEGAVT
jgi:hypothetical protein